MAALDDAVHAVLAGHTPLAALVADRIFPVEAPQGAARPYVVFSRAETEVMGTLAGGGTHVSADVTVLCFAEDSLAAAAVARAVRAALDGLQGHAVLAGVRLVDRTQGLVEEIDADPLLVVDGMLFRVLAVGI